MSDHFLFCSPSKWCYCSGLTMPLAPLKEPWHQVARGANAADTENGKSSQVGVSPFDASKCYVRCFYPY